MNVILSLIFLFAFLIYCWRSRVPVQELDITRMSEGWMKERAKVAR